MCGDALIIQQSSGNEYHVRLYGGRILAVIMLGVPWNVFELPKCWIIRVLKYQVIHVQKSIDMEVHSITQLLCTDQFKSLESLPICSGLVEFW